MSVTTPPFIQEEAANRTLNVLWTVPEDIRKVNAWAAISVGSILDALLAYLAASFVLSLESDWSSGALSHAISPMWGPNVTALAFAIFTFLMMQRHHVYRSYPHVAGLDELLAVAKAICTATVLLMASCYVGHGPRLSLSMLFAFAAGTFALTALSHYGIRKYREKRVRAGVAGRNVLIVGAGRVGRALAERLMANPTLGYRFRGFLDDYRRDSTVLGRMDDLAIVVRMHFIDEIFITIPSERELVKRFAIEAPRHKVNVSTVLEAFDGIGYGTPLEYVADIAVRCLHREQQRPLQMLIKRFFDLAASGIGLVVVAPLMAIIAIAVKLDSPGPVFYRPKRIGLKGRTFSCFKFRTMVADADARLKELEHLNERDGILFKMSNDPRVTRVGALLRRYSFDELPQLFNVFVGEMSLVGPRPPEPNEYNRYRLEHLRRLDVVPGITGLWQVTARRDPSFETYIQRDLEYIENWSLWLDFKILLRTILVVLEGTGQ